MSMCEDVLREMQIKTMRHNAYLAEWWNPSALTMLNAGE